MKDENNIWLQGDLSADNLAAEMAEKTAESRHILLEAIDLTITDQKNIALETKLSADQLTLSLGENLQASASIKTDKFSFRLNEDTLKMSSHLVFSQGKLVLDKTRTIEASPRLELDLQIPLKDFQKVVYKGSLTLSDEKFEKGSCPLNCSKGWSWTPISKTTRPASTPFHLMPLIQMSASTARSKILRILFSTSPLKRPIWIC